LNLRAAATSVSSVIQVDIVAFSKKICSSSYLSPFLRLLSLWQYTGFIKPRRPLQDCPPTNQHEQVKDDLHFPPTFGSITLTPTNCGRGERTLFLTKFCAQQMQHKSMISLFTLDIKLRPNLVKTRINFG
jgi:hypothetical protein